MAQVMVMIAFIAVVFNRFNVCSVEDLSHGFTGPTTTQLWYDKQTASLPEAIGTEGKPGNAPQAQDIKPLNRQSVAVLRLVYCFLQHLWALALHVFQHT